MAIKHNISIDQGADFTIEFDVLDGNSEPIDFSSQIITAKMKKHYESANSISFSCNGYSNGAITISLTPAQTQNVTPGRYMYDVYADDVETLIRVVEGIATINPMVTK